MAEKTLTIAEMNSSQLANHITSIEENHRRRVKHLRALLRAVSDQEDANGSGAEREGG